MNIVKHIAVTFCALLLFLGVPALLYADIPSISTGEVDAVSRATTELPEQPSGDFVVLLNEKRYGNTLDQWRLFFSGGDGGVIMDDLRCLVAESDKAAFQLGERYQARLAENQMELRRENGLMLASKVENGLFDVVILSRELSDAYQLEKVYENSDILCIAVHGE